MSMTAAEGAHRAGAPTSTSVDVGLAIGLPGRFLRGRKNDIDESNPALLEELKIVDEDIDESNPAM